jgi:hypothetical protein
VIEMLRRPKKNIKPDGSRARTPCRNARCDDERSRRRDWFEGMVSSDLSLTSRPGKKLRTMEFAFLWSVRRLNKDDETPQKPSHFNGDGADIGVSKSCAEKMCSSIDSCLS